MKLVICEKNIAAKRIAEILSRGRFSRKLIGKIPSYEFFRDNEKWLVIGLKGHIVNLDYPAEFNRWNRVNLHDLIWVEPCKNVSERDVVNALRIFGTKTDYIIVATDYDREGELIGVEALDIIKKCNPNIINIKRARFSAITQSEVLNAFSKPVDIDYNLANAAEARQIIDLVWGATLTRFISIASGQLGKDFLSIGRVQSPTLAIIVNREKEIRSFIPKPYWQIIATLKNNISFDAIHEKNIFWDEKEAREIYERIKDSKKARVKDIKRSLIKVTPPSPFNTTLFLQAASAHLKISASRAMEIAEQLYMNGWISYPRTDNTVYPKTINIYGILKTLERSPFSGEVSEVLNNGRAIPTRGKKFATDHPPIHPVGVPPINRLSKDEWRIYELICRRFLATLAKDAVIESIEAKFDIKNETFLAKGYNILEKNWLSIYPYQDRKYNPLPLLKKDEEIDVVKINNYKKKTQPPKRYTHGTLIAEMERLGLGTKSTRHEIIKKLYSRKYIVGANPIPTATAFAVIEAIEKYDIAKPDMTAKLEKDMDAIAEGKKTLEETIKESRKMLQKVLTELEKGMKEIGKKIRKALAEQNKVGICPKCGGSLVIKKSHKGKRFIACDNYPKCENTYSLPQKGRIQIENKKCKMCNSPVIKIISTNGNRWEICINPDCPSKKKK
jgi:DNA topoisomerase-1